ncbi:hypothetical protein A1O7_05848 [Cladophialophora yegresii CBS 114405]|uniref:Zn(2)-C6 fungal-type domain-containing protein n=1 Tax=Cladophialophora yegresii CBS 114405 TaxID=1182544 RepID=W9VSA0_9EURO|nr:uncharacterized protein A1O7_05848 [Cladophialophora yegresii CBS 114405]EXJ58423.1 hypothetical protein A1O7_05848 [Cladophialophora yegresii CBS 114405]
MSLRMSSLDPNEPRAAKGYAGKSSRDCRTCNRRRIRCDRSLPTCKKCALKELTCPGYGLRIQFGQGVASRGKLTGKALPIIEPAPRESAGSQENFSPKSTTPGEISDAGEDGFEFSTTTLSGAKPVATSRPSYRSVPSGYDGGTFHNQFALDLELSSHVLPDYLQGRPVRELLHYFDHHVATVMPWVDGPENPWRKLLLPLALESESLLLALLALSAEHYTSRRDSSWPLNGGFLSSNYRDRSLQLLARDLRAEVIEDANSPRKTQASTILATILVLCNLEMIRCDTTTWHVHWKAARTITKRWTATDLASTILDDTCRFLLKEAFVYDVFGSSTTFGDNDQIPSSVLTKQEANVFTDWLQLIQDVTRAERRRNDNPFSAEEASVALANMQGLQEKFEYARDRSRTFSRRFDFGTPGPHNDFTVLIDIFHYAGLAYSFQALLNTLDHAVQASLQDHVTGVITAMGQIRNKDAYQHDLVWPLFVVGTQSRHNKDTQDFAETKLLEVMNSTGFSNCYPALEFLRRFWATDPLVVADWMQFARQESRQGKHFLVI